MLSTCLPHEHLREWSPLGLGQDLEGYTARRALLIWKGGGGASEPTVLQPSTSAGGWGSAHMRRRADARPARAVLVDGRSWGVLSTSLAHEHLREWSPPLRLDHLR